MPFKSRNTHSGQARGSLRKKKNRQRRRELAQIGFQFATGKVLFERIDEIILLIPDDFDNKKTVEMQLKSRQESIPYTAPEVIGTRWHQVAAILSNYLPFPSERSWSQKIADLFIAPVPA